MKTLTEILGTPLSTELNDYKFSALTLSEWGHLLRYFQFKEYREAEAAELPKDICENILEECKNKKVDFEDVEFRLFLAHPDASYKLLQLSLNIEHKEFKKADDVRKLNLNRKQVRELQREILKLSLGEDAIEETNDDENPTN